MMRRRAIAARWLAGCIAVVLATSGAAASADDAVAPSAAPASTQAAIGALAGSFPGLAHSEPGQSAVAVVGPGARVDDYLTDAIARVTDASGHRVVVASNRPLRTDRGPVDLDLRQQGNAVVPANAPFDLTMADEPAQGFWLGPTEARRVHIVPGEVAASHGPAVDLNDQVFFAATAPDADTLLRPQVNGLETFAQLRSADAPESFSWRLDLTPAQAATLDGEGNLTVTQDGVAILTVPAPVAMDAAGRIVPTADRLQDDVLTVQVSHRDGAFTYPIEVDPEWQSSYDWDQTAGIGQEGWHVLQDAMGGPGYTIGVGHDPNGPRPGLNIYPNGDPAAAIPYPENSYGELYWQSPGTTRIVSVDWHDVYRVNDAARQTMRLAVYRDDGSQAVPPDDYSTSSPVLHFDQDVVQAPAAADGRFAILKEFTPPCQLGEMNCPRGISSSTGTEVRVGSVDLVLSDDDDPTIAVTGDLASLANTWTNRADSAGYTIATHDSGSGVESAAFSDSDLNGTHALPAPGSVCDPTHNTAGQDDEICPMDDSQAYSLNLAGLHDGRNTFAATTTDYASNSSSDDGGDVAFDAYFDRVVPGVTASGELYDAAGTWYHPTGSAQLTLHGTDDRSGVAHLQLDAYGPDGHQILHDVTDTCSNPGPIAAPCPTGVPETYSVNTRNLPEGDVRFVAHSTDYATNVSTDLSWIVHVDRTPPAARAHGDLVALADQWTNTTGPVSVTLDGKDSGSGVKALSLVAVNADGRTVLGSVDTCPTHNSDGSCPHTATGTVTVDASNLPDGHSHFVAQATDLSGQLSVDGTDWDTYVDHTPPDAPGDVTVDAKSTDTVHITWDRVEDQPDGSGDVSYEYLVMVNGVRQTTWTETINHDATVSDLPPNARVEVFVRARDHSGNVSRSVTGSGSTPRAAAAASLSDADLAARFQPLVHVDRNDGFYPIPFPAVFHFSHPPDGSPFPRETCLEDADQKLLNAIDCPWSAHLSDLGSNNGQGKHLTYPAGFLRDQEAYAEASGLSDHIVTGHPVDYYFVQRRPDGLKVVEYWFFYSYNYYDGPKGDEDKHQGDWERVDAVVGPDNHLLRTHFWQHGEMHIVNPGSYQISYAEHVRTYAAEGDHADYPACSGAHSSYVAYSFLGQDFDDYTCEHSSDPDRTYTFGIEAPRVTLKGLPWACWRGGAGTGAHDLFGQAGGDPAMPLRQDNHEGAAPNCPGESQSRTDAYRSLASSAPRASAEACPDFEQPPSLTGTVLVLACDQAALDRYDRSGASHRDANRLSIESTKGRQRDDAARHTVPPEATDRSLSAVEDERVLSSGIQHPTIYIAETRADGSYTEAHFPAVTVGPGVVVSPHVTGPGAWTLRDGADHVLARATPQHTAHDQLPPPRILAAVRHDGRLVIRFTFGQPSGTHFLLGYRHAGQGGSTIHRSVKIVSHVNGRYVGIVRIPRGRLAPRACHLVGVLGHHRRSSPTVPVRVA
jgi:hypothetical protein